MAALWRKHLPLPPSPYPLEKEAFETVTYEFNKKVSNPVNRRLDKNLEKHHAVMMATSVVRIKTTAHAQKPSVQLCKFAHLSLSGESWRLCFMDEIEEFKNFMGSLAKDYNEAELRQLHYEMHAMAQLLLDIYLDKMSSGRPDQPSNEHFDTPKTER